MRHLSLCSGIGGIDLAAEWAGFETVAQCEIDDYASKVLAKNFKGVPNLHDIRTVTNKRIREFGIDPAGITVISAGFPCQPYSLAGKGRGDRDDRDLWGEVARVLEEVRPRWFVGENTPGLFSREDQRYFRRILSDLTELGYQVGWGIWGACDVGAPHKRDRVFIVGRYTDGERAKEKCSIQKRKNSESCGVGGNISDTAFKRRDKITIQCGQFIEGVQEERGGRIQISGCKPNGMYSGAKWWEVEPDVGRVAYGVSHWVDRLRCLGNAVVPAQIYPIFEAIAEFERL